MTIILTDDRADFTNQGAMHPAIRSIAGAVVRWRARRAQRVALQSLLELDAHRLDDLGLSVEAVRDAMA
jgi:uncharacterized protein YjiS (DUF1127 family)